MNTSENDILVENKLILLQKCWKNKNKNTYTNPKPTQIFHHVSGNNNILLALIIMIYSTENTAVNPKQLCHLYLHGRTESITIIIVDNITDNILVCHFV